MSSGKMPINQEKLYFDLAEVDLGTGAGGFAGMEPQGFQVTLNVDRYHAILQKWGKNK
jgi:hypothetical protein